MRLESLDVNVLAWMTIVFIQSVGDLHSVVGMATSLALEEFAFDQRWTMWNLDDVI